MNHPDRLLPPQPQARALARRLYDGVRSLPIISPHGHTDPEWFASDAPFADPASLFVTPDHYLLRMLHSQGVPLSDLGVPPSDRGAYERNAREIWRRFCSHYHLFRGTPTRLWLEQALVESFGVAEPPSEASADRLFDLLSEKLQEPAFRPRALFERFGIEVLATTESPLDDLNAHRRIRESGWAGRVITTYRPDPVVDPEYEGFAENLARFGEIARCDVGTWRGYLDAHRRRRADFKAAGATATDHGHPSARTLDMSEVECEQLYGRALAGSLTGDEAEAFRAQMLTEMAKMSLEDGLVLQIHPGAFRNHDLRTFARFGRDKGGDVPMAMDYVHALQPLLNRVGHEPGARIIVFTLDESTYSRELAPLAGHYPALFLGPAWWFHDSPEGMRRYREMTTETAGFYNTVGFNDDTRAFFSIPGRHDVARRCDCGFLARLVLEHRLDEDEAHVLAAELAYGLAKSAYRL